MVDCFVAKTQKGRRFFWNIEANVGLNSPNRPDDVQLVQFGFFASQFVPDAEPEEKVAYARVVPGVPYTARPDDPLSQAIDTFEKLRGGPRDGHVSVIKGTGLITPTMAFMMIALSNAMQMLSRDDFPRIDKHARCPLLLADKVQAFFIA